MCLGVGGGGCGVVRLSGGAVVGVLRTLFCLLLYCIKIYQQNYIRCHLFQLYVMCQWSTAPPVYYSLILVWINPVSFNLYLLWIINSWLHIDIFCVGRKTCWNLLWITAGSWQGGRKARVRMGSRFEFLLVSVYASDNNSLQTMTVAVLQWIVRTWIRTVKTQTQTRFTVFHCNPVQRYKVFDLLQSFFFCVKVSLAIM